MAHAETCPVCQGTGKVYGVLETGAFPTQTCHGCGGAGWVTVQDTPGNKTIYFPQYLLE